MVVVSVVVQPGLVGLPNRPLSSLGGGAPGVGMMVGLKGEVTVEQQWQSVIASSKMALGVLYEHTAPVHCGRCGGCLAKFDGTRRH